MKSFLFSFWFLFCVFLFGSFSVFFSYFLLFVVYLPLNDAVLLFSIISSNCANLLPLCHTHHPLQSSFSISKSRSTSLPLRWAEKSLQLPLGCWDFISSSEGCLSHSWGSPWPPSTKHLASFQPLQPPSLALPQT